ncbi:MAG: P-loop NTPase [Nitriliruptorales bacterium]|nr:P-loop NTPase [Nitriliruptorales bacterium]
MPSIDFVSFLEHRAEGSAVAEHVTEAAVRAVLGTVDEPDIRRPITELGMVRGVVVAPGQVQVGVALTVPNHPLKERIASAVTDAIRRLGPSRVHVDFTAMSEEDRGALRMSLQGPAHERGEPFAESRVVAVSSGKGGVGKSSLSANLAVALARRGKRVALIDADVYGFSIPRMIGIDRRPVIIDNMVIPPRVHDVAVISVALFASDEQTPIIWRGPMLHKALQQFISDVYWDSPDEVIIDMPPGTGDVALTMAQILPLSEVVVVTTPQPAAQKVAQRAAYMARKVNLTVSGVVENMSWFTGNDGVRYELFGAGGGDLLAQQLGVPLLGRIPLVPALRAGSDVGRPVVLSDPDGEAARAIEAVADRLLTAPTRRRRLPLLKVT